MKEKGIEKRKHWGGKISRFEKEIYWEEKILKERKLREKDLKRKDINKKKHWERKLFRKGPFKREKYWDRIWKGENIKKN